MGELYRRADTTADTWTYSSWQHDTEYRVLYTSTTDFLNEFIDNL